MERGEKALEASCTAQGDQLHHLSMTISLAAVFIPLVFMPGWSAASSRVRHHHGGVISIFASGIVSLTLTR